MANIRYIGKRKRGRKESEKDKEINYVLEKIHHYPDKLRFKNFVFLPKFRPYTNQREKYFIGIIKKNLNQF